jgi:trans-AT polyketide synthase, acyltransferase and oxidoreductase domains
MNVCDTAYVPSLELFELGGRAQVVKKGFFFSARANKLYELYRNVSSLSQLDGKTRSQLEDKYFGRTITAVLEECRSRMNGHELVALNEDPKQQMAAVFKWYMERARQSAIAGDASNKVNYSIMCGPAMGAFNQWVKNTSLEYWKNRHAGKIAAAMMNEAAALSKGGVL